MTNVNKWRQGQITVFLSIILLAVICLACVLVEGARLAVGDAQVRRSVSSGARSALAAYDSRLKEEYGLFALDSSDAGKLEELVREYTGKNLMVRGTEEEGNTAWDFIKETVLDLEEATGGTYLHLFDYGLDTIQVTPAYNLSENDVVKNQILQYMKYRAPVQLGEEIWNKLSTAGKAAGMSQVYEKKIQVDKLLGKMDKLQQKLRKNIEGEGSSPGVNGFNREQERDKLADRYVALTQGSGSTRNELLQVSREIEEMEQQIAAETLKEQIKELKGKLKALQRRQNELAQRLETEEKEMNDTFRKLQEDGTRVFEKPNKEAEQNLQALLALCPEVESAIRDLETAINGASSDEDKLTGGEYEQSLKEDLEMLKKLAVESETVEEMLQQTRENRSSLERLLMGLEQAAELVRQSTAEAGRLKALINNGLELYSNRLDYFAGQGNGGDGGIDPREANAADAKALMEETEGRNIRLEDLQVDLERLPSHRKTITPDFAERDREYLEEASREGLPVSVMPEAAEYGGNLENMGSEVDFEEEDAGFSQQAFSFIGSIGELLSTGLESFRDRLYLDAYILGTFKNAVPEIKLEGNGNKISKPDLDLRGMDKKLRNTVFDAEVEYILHGSTSQKANLNAVKAELLLLRFAVNTLHVYTDPEKKQLAYSIATAVAGWWTGGAGIPIVANLIMCGWGMGEAVVDVEHLLKGEAVPFYKLKGDWETRIGTGKDLPKSDPRLCFTYHDYLRLFLLLEGENKKLDRIEDLIQLNLGQARQGFKLADCSTCLRVEAQVSMNYVFMTPAILPRGTTMKNGRHVFRVLTYEGY